MSTNSIQHVKKCIGDYSVLSIDFYAR